MKITHLVESQANTYGGPAVSVPWLASSSCDSGHEVSIISVDKNTAENLLISDLGLTWKRVMPQGPISARFSPGLASAIRASRPDILHLHNLWNYVAFSAYHFCSTHNIPLVISPRSGLYASSLRKGRLKKYIALEAFQRRAIFESSCIHVTSQGELNEVRDFGYRGPVAVIPNLLRPRPFSPDIQKNNEIVFLCMSRLHPRKNIDKLIEGFSVFSRETASQVRLNIVGPSDEGYLRTIKNLIENSGQAAKIKLFPMATGPEKDRHFAEADAFILISEFENFGMSIAEALAVGLPVICSTGTPWVDIEHFRAGYCISPDASSLNLALQKILPDLTLDRIGCAERSRTYFDSIVNPDLIAKMYDQFYQWILNGGTPPDFVDV